MSDDINENIKRLIDKLGISVYEFSRQIGNDRPTNVYNIVNKKVKISPVTLDKIFRRYPEWKDFVLNGSEGGVMREVKKETSNVVHEPTPKYTHPPMNEFLEYLKEKDAELREKEKEIRQLIRDLATVEAKLEIAKKGGHCLKEKESGAGCADVKLG
jgi:hypothetical protein